MSYRFLKDGLIAEILGEVCKGDVFLHAKKHHSYEVTLSYYYYKMVYLRITIRSLIESSNMSAGTRCAGGFSH